MQRNLLSHFQELNKQCLILEPALGNDIRCPVCWQRLGPCSFQEKRISKEHVPPTKVAKLVGERPLVTLTCEECNNGFGTKYQDDLKRFVIHQLQNYGKYDKPIRGQVAIENNEPMSADITLTSKSRKIAVAQAPKANDPRNIQKNMDALNYLGEKGITDWHCTVKGNYGYRLPAVQLAYLHAAYLLATTRTECYYAYSEAGEQVRGLFSDNNKRMSQNYLISLLGNGMNVDPWMAVVTDPPNLRCLWVKIAGNIVILPTLDRDVFSCWQEWSKICDMTPFGMRPHSKISLRMNFLSKKDT